MESHSSSTQSSNPETPSDSKRKARQRRVRIRRKRRRAAAPHPHQGPSKPIGGMSVETAAKLLATQASVAFDRSKTTKEPSHHSNELFKAANGYADCLYKQLLYNSNDTSIYRLREARILAKATDAMSKRHCS